VGQGTKCAYKYHDECNSAGGLAYKKGQHVGAVCELCKPEYWRRQKQPRETVPEQVVRYNLYFSILLLTVSFCITHTNKHTHTYTYTYVHCRLVARNAEDRAGQGGATHNRR
jgi:hypothetical protein